MKRVFIGGSRRISRVPPEVRSRLDEMIRRGLPVVVGDANGADKAIQAYFAGQQYDHVTVFCTGSHCRNNVGGWPVRTVTAPHAARDFGYFTAKDAAMADEADVALMLWDGQSAGTMVNVARLVARGKPTVVYVATMKAFQTVKTLDELTGLLSTADPEVRTKVEHYIHEHVTELAQLSTSR